MAAEVVVAARRDAYVGLDAILLDLQRDLGGDDAAMEESIQLLESTRHDEPEGRSDGQVAPCEREPHGAVLSQGQYRTLR